MSRNLLVVMFVAVLAAGAWVLLDRDEEAPALNDPVAAIDFSGLVRIECRARGIGEWTMVREDDHWTLTSAALAGGAPVAADAARVQRIVGFLRDSKAHDRLEAAAIDLAEWGLEPPEVELLVDDGGAVHELEFGKVDLEDELFYRAKGGSVVFKVGAQIVSDLRIDPRHLRHPGLADVSPHLVQRVEIVRADDGVTLERVANRWFIVQPDGARRRGDPSLCDQLVTAVVAVTGVPVPDAPLSATPVGRVRITDRDDRVHEYVLHRLDEKSGGYLAQRPDEPDLRLTPRTTRRWFERVSDDLVDPIFTGFDPSGLAKIVLEGKGRPDRLEMMQRHGRWWVRFYERFAWRSDPTSMTRVREELLALRVERYVAPTEFEPVLSARFSFEDAGASSPDVVVDVSAPRDDGLALVRRSDETGCALVTTDAVEAFRVRYWDVMARDVCVGNDEAISSVSITLRSDGETWTATRRDGTWESSRGAVVAPEFLTGLFGRLAYLSVAEYLGDIDDHPKTRAALDDPVCTVVWYQHESNTPERPSPDAPGVEHEKWWKLVRRIDDTRFACVCSVFPRLVFTVDAHDLTRIEDALRGIRGG